jgi:predicted acetyltransferase
VVHQVAEEKAFAGTINLRYQIGSSMLPSYCLGHIGYAVVPWMAGRGVASFALRQLIREAGDMGHLNGMQYLEVTTQTENLASQRVIAKCGGVLVERYTEPLAYGGHEGLRYRIPLV